MNSGEVFPLPPVPCNPSSRVGVSTPSSRNCPPGVRQGHCQPGPPPGPPPGPSLPPSGPGQGTGESLPDSLVGPTGLAPGPGQGLQGNRVHESPPSSPSSVSTESAPSFPHFEILSDEVNKNSKETQTDLTGEEISFMSSEIKRLELLKT